MNGCRVNNIEGYERTVIRCRGCKREVVRIGIGNGLVGCQERMRCSVCGHRGADMLRIWSTGKAPTAEIVPLIYMR